MNINISLTLGDEQYRKLEQFVQRIIAASPREAQQSGITDVESWVNATLKQMLSPIIGEE